MGFSFEKPSDPYSHLHRIQSWIRHSQPRVRNMQIANFNAPVVFLSQDMSPDGRRGSEVNGVCERGNILIRKQHPAAQFKIGGDTSSGSEIPFQI